MLEKLPEIVKTTADVSSISVLIAVFLDMLPHIASILTIIWMLILICESKTCKRFSGWAIRSFKKLIKKENEE